MLGIYALLNCLVLVSKLLSIIDHSLDFLRRQPALIVCNRDSLFLAHTFLDTCHSQDAVLVDLEGHLDLRHAACCGWKAGQIESSERMVVLDHRTLTLKD